jgi:hypothetical protein
MRARDFINHLYETPNQVRISIHKKLNDIDDESDLKDILSYANQYTFKSDVKTLSATKGYKDTVSGIILQAVGKLDAPTEDVKDFLRQLSTDGIITEKSLLTPRSVHKMEQIIDRKYLKIFSKIKLDLFEKISGKIGEKGDVGKGEYLLSILSPNISRRGAPGDLDVDGHKIELKAGSSGRLGPAGSQSLAGRFDEFVEGLTKMNLIPEDSEIPDPVSMNFSLNMTSFANFFNNDNAVIKKALGLMLKMHYPGYDVIPIVNASVQGGQIDGQELKKQMLMASYSVYQTAKEFDGVILTDYGMDRYLYINTPENAGAISTFVSVKFPSWTDTQSNTIKIQLKSGQRDPASSSPATTAPTRKIAKSKSPGVANKMATLAASAQQMGQDPRQVR